jgi:mannosyltransferase
MQSIKEACASQKRITALLLILILAFAVIIRIINLGAESIWLDEASSVTLARLPLAGIIDLVSREDVHPPLYYLALHYWVMLAGDSESAVRLLSVLFAALSILVIHRVASLLFDRWTGLLSALLLSVSLLHILFSQEARMYALLGLLSLLSFYFLIRLFEGDESSLIFTGYLVSTALLPYTQVYGWFVIAAENLFFLSLYLLSRGTFQRLIKRWIFAQVLVVALFLPWVPVMMQQISRVQQSFWIPAPSLRLLGLTLNEYVFSNSLLWIYPLLIALCIISHWKFNRRSVETDLQSSAPARREAWFSDRYKIYFLLTWLLVPVLVPFMLSYFMRPIFLPKYTIAALPAFVILAARGLMDIRFALARLLLIALILYLSVSGLRGYWGTQRKPDWRNAVGYFNQMAKPNDLVLFYPSFSQVPFDYYLRHSDVTKEPVPDLNPEVTPDKLGELLRAKLKGHERVWLVLHSLENESTVFLKKQLGEMYNLRAEEILPGIEVHLYEGRRTE